MAKVRGPLYSAAARGTIARTLTYAAPDGRPICRRSPPPSRPAIAAANAAPTPARAAHRSAVTAAVEAWHGATIPQRLALAALAPDQHLPLYHRYIRAYLRQPPTTTGTTWDGGSTTWDGGSTTWDN